MQLMVLRGTGELEDLLVEVPPVKDDCYAFNRGWKPQDTLKWTLKRPLAQIRRSIRLPYRDVIKQATPKPLRCRYSC